MSLRRKSAIGLLILGGLLLLLAPGAEIGFGGYALIALGVAVEIIGVALERKT